MKSKFKVGDRVRVLGFGTYGEGADGFVREVQAPFGGKHHYRLGIYVDPFEPQSWVGDDDSLLPLPAVEPKGTIEPAAAAATLKDGTLLLILTHGWHVERDRPRAWLRPSSSGKRLTYTLYEDRGWLGGGFIPLNAAYDLKIFGSKRDEVAAFLRTFGLDDAQIEEVIRAVGVNKKR